MKIKDGFIVREVAGEWIAVAVGTRTAEFPGVIALSETAAFVWKHLEKDNTVEQLVRDLTDEFQVDDKTAEADVKTFLESLSQEGLLADE